MSFIVSTTDRGEGSRERSQRPMPPVLTARAARNPIAFLAAPPLRPLPIYKNFVSI